MAHGYGSKADISVMEGIVARLEELTDPADDSMCAVSPEHKEGVRIYVETWITPAVKAVLAHLRDGEKVEGYLVADARRASRQHNERTTR